MSADPDRGIHRQARGPVSFNWMPVHASRYTLQPLQPPLNGQDAGCGGSVACVACVVSVAIPRRSAFKEAERG